MRIAIQRKSLRYLRNCAAGVLLLGLGSWSLETRARSQEAFPYRFELAWASAVRMIRVDLGFEITEKDRDNGYLLFQYTEGHRSFPGSLELVPVQLEGRDGVQVIAQVSAMPAYVEQVLLKRLARKLSQDHGEPPRPKPPQRPKEPSAPDAPENPDGTAPKGD